MEDQAIYSSMVPKNLPPMFPAGSLPFPFTHEDSYSPDDRSSSTKPVSSKPCRQKRSHTKSRQGCLNCKTRRVKCQETRPYPCANCVGRNMTCEYPSSEQMRHRSRRQDKEPSPDPTATTLTPRSEPLPSSTSIVPFSSGLGTKFTTDDMRFFHHFLVFAHPHLPFGSDELWKTQLPVYAHECQHLMHAILSLGAAHLSSIKPCGVDYTALSIVHRGKALKGLADALSNADHCSTTELDLLLATTYALIFQARSMADGLADFAIMIRGSGILTCKILSKYRKSEIFKLLRPSDIFAHVASQIPLAPYSDPTALETSIQTLERIQPLLQNNGHHLAYQSLLGSYKGLQFSTRRGFIAYTAIYESWRQMNNQEFMNLLDPTNTVSQILLLHYISVTAMLRPVFNQLIPPRILQFPKDTVVEHQWGCDIYESLPSEIRPLVDWQAQFIATNKALIESGCSSSL